MPLYEALKLAVSAILSHKLRSFLTLLGVIFGVATVIVVVSLVEGFNAYVDEKIANIGTNAFAVRKFSIEDFASVEAQARRNVCFLGADVAEKLFPTSEPLGQTVRIDGRPYQVIGVGKALGSVFGQPRDMYVGVPLSTFLSTYGMRRSISIVVTSAGEAAYHDAIEQVRLLMRARRKLAPGERDSFGIITPEAINE